MICYIKTNNKLTGHREQRISMEMDGAIPVIMYHYMFTDDPQLKDAQSQLIKH